MLAETGIIGALLAIGGYALLTAAGVGSVRRRSGSERLVAAALLAAIVIYGVHALFDWDWDIPGVTLPALLFLGVLAGAGGRKAAGPEERSDNGAGWVTRTAYGPGARAVALVAVAAALCAVALSGVVPSVAAGRASAAVVAASGPSGSALKQARSDAAEATRLDPLSDAGLLASATIAIRSGQYAQARADLLQAVKRDPNDVQAWQRIAVVEFAFGSASGTFNAIQRVFALDPKGPEVKTLPRQVELLLTPPFESATARASPKAGS
jgi:tetratricopeptide (TPR) repeat protein